MICLRSIIKWLVIKKDWLGGINMYDLINSIVDSLLKDKYKLIELGDDCIKYLDVIKKVQKDLILVRSKTLNNKKNQFNNHLLYVEVIRDSYKINTSKEKIKEMINGVDDEIFECLYHIAIILYD